MIQSTIDKLLTNWSFGNFMRKLIFANEIIQDISQTGTFANSRIYEHMSYWTPNHVRIPFSSLCCFLSANMLNVSIHLAILNHLKCIAWKLFVLGVFLVRIFPHSDWIRTRKTPNTDTFQAVKTISFQFVECVEDSL